LRQQKILGCNPDLCIVKSVVAQFELTLNGEFISYEGNETDGKEGRMMNENQDSSHRQLQDESATNIEGYLGFSFCNYHAFFLVLFFFLAFYGTHIVLRA
jgi:hypothetical protein